MSIVRIGLAETKNFAEGYEAIFGKKKSENENQEEGKEAKTSAKGENKDDTKGKKKPGKKK
jgi:hypothetical protein